jgi:hypothetical protein
MQRGCIQVYFKNKMQLSHLNSLWRCTKVIFYKNRITYLEDT